VRFRFRLGKRAKLGRLTPEQGAVLKRLEAGEITADEAAKELDGTAHSWTWSFGTGSNESSKPAAEAALTPSQPAEDDPPRRSWNASPARWTPSRSRRRARLHWALSPS
jgi:hypothetical protein